MACHIMAIPNFNRLRVLCVKVGSAQGSLAAAGFVIEVMGGQESGDFWVVGYVYVIGLWCVKLDMILYAIVDDNQTYLN